MQCRTRGAILPPQTDFPGCWLTARSRVSAPMFRRTCVSGCLSVSSRHGWRPKSERVPQPFLAAFSASLAAFSELVNTTVVLAARSRQTSTNGDEVIDSKRFSSWRKFCVRLGPPPEMQGGHHPHSGDLVNVHWKSRARAAHSRCCLAGGDSPAKTTSGASARYGGL